MDVGSYSIAELADRAGLSRRAIRYYVQQKLLPSPHGLGRGKHYDDSHLQRLQRIRGFQLAGHSLDEIRQLILVPPGEAVHAPQRRARPADRSGPSPPKSAVTPALRAELWRRLRVMEGVELNFDASRFSPTVEELQAIREAIVAALLRHGPEQSGPSEPSVEEL